MKKFKRNAATGLLVLTTGLSGALGYQNIGLANANKELKSNIIESKKNIEQLNTDLEKLENNYNSSVNSLEKITEKYEKELEEKEELIKNNEELAAENKKLSSAASARQVSKTSTTSTLGSTSGSTTSTSKPSGTKIQLSASELNLLERLVECEAGGEPVIGQIAVVNVVLNRKNSSEFPNTITGVIHEKGQFSPVSSGYINNVTVSSQVKSSVQRALNGETAVSSDTLYFFATWVSKDNPIRDHVTITKTIGNHHFGK